MSTETLESLPQQTPSGSAAPGGQTPPPAAPAKTTAMTKEPAAKTVEIPAGDWRSNIPEELRGDPSLEKFKDVASLAKSYINAQKMMGQDKVVIPGPNATAEEIATYRSKMGVPEKAEQYELPKEDVPPDVQFDQDVMQEFFGLAHKTNMNKTQVAELARWQAKKIAAFRTAEKQKVEQARNQALEGFKKELGHSFDESMSLARKAAKQFGGEEFVNFLNETGMGDDPRMVKTWIKVGRSLASDSIHGEGVSRAFIPSPDEAREQLQSLKNDPEFVTAYNNTRHPKHAESMRKWHAAMDAAYPSDKAE